MYRIKEIEFQGGVAGATSFYSNHWLPENGFKRQSLEGNGWHIGSPPTSQSPPVMIWYDFKAEGFRPAEVRLVFLTGTKEKMSGLLKA